VVCFLFVGFFSPEEYLEILLWRLIISPLLQALGDLLRPSKQLRQSQHFGNIANYLDPKKTGGWCREHSLQRRVCRSEWCPGATRASSACFCARCASVPSGRPWSAGAVEKPSAGTRGRLAEERGQKSLQSDKCRCLTLRGSLAENISSFPLPRRRTVICNS